ncbi:hypothetical protein DDE18_16360 [Nocardioides gansuensis]|uniref:Putative zinc-finger domain-containing protein n=1 Tax=Nocardioides gansuensis TaxID=2138300 RepID=A0A2T8F786_9ACTN|nr:zf-HC2 domain-containing protein [Nocardioides gansuensis]PVG81581.1 hypothetical protein DDE18_16360 [Nocardioides gansuensis]
MAHLGPKVSALLDGRLSPEEEERAWAHVHTCHPCRDLVEREGWVKTRLASLSLDGGAAPAGLKDSLLRPPAFPTSLTGAGSTAAGHGHGHSSRSRGLVAVGGGAAGAAVVGVLALGIAGSPQLDRRPPVTDLVRPTSSSTPDPARPQGARRRATPDRLAPATVQPPFGDWAVFGDRVAREKMVP